MLKMTFTDLHKILDDKNRRLSLDELKQVIYELKQDCFTEFGKALETKTQNRQEIRNIGFYDGEQNAFQIALDLLEHLEKTDFGTFGDTINEILDGVNDLFPKLDYSEYTWLFDAISKLPYLVAEIINNSIKLPYLLCTSNKFACVIWRDKDGKVKKTYTMPIEEAKGVLKEKEKLCNTND